MKIKISPTPKRKEILVLVREVLKRESSWKYCIANKVGKILNSTNGGIMSKIFRERTNLRTITVSIIVALVGAFLLFFVSRLSFLDAYPEWQSLIKDFGSLIFASVAVALIWELFSKRAFMSELLTTTKLADEIQESGLVKISPQWHGEINWTELFRKNDYLKILFMYGRTWRNINRAELQRFASKSNSKATIILPDIENPRLISELAQSIDVTADELKARINESVQEFVAIFNIEGQGENKLEIFYTSIFPTYSFYQFDSVAIVTFYTMSRNKKAVPTLVFEKGGTLFDFFISDFNDLLNSDACRKIYP